VPVGVRQGPLRRHHLPPLPGWRLLRCTDREGVLLSRGGRRLFEIYYALAGTFETVNTLGQPLYARMIPDRDRDEWVRLEIESNPLPICTRPQLLRSAIARRADATTDFGDARLWSETTRLDLRVADVSEPRPGDRIEIDEDAFLIQGEPLRDRERLVWTIDLRPA
jgi:hypothetical protein